ncbi:NAD-dependent epimerase/dehydratase family protein [Cupriavidus basilensis]
MHFAALEAVWANRSANRWIITNNNLNGLLALCSAMNTAGVKQLVFSSSATVYGNPHSVPILGRAFPLSATSPYGQTKLMSEQILRDLERSGPDWRIAYLRYFNPAVGARKRPDRRRRPRRRAGLRLMPYVAQVAGGRREKLMVHGGDYPTVDGTGVRDSSTSVILRPAILRPSFTCATSGNA